jgi:hypothetical protein
VFACEVFGMVMAKVCAAGGPLDDEMFLSNAIPDPIEVHVHCLSLSLLYCVIRDADCSGVVGGDGGRFE